MCLDPCIAVKHGSRMVDGSGEFRVYQNFWCAHRDKDKTIG